MPSEDRHAPAKHIMEVLRTLELEASLAPADPRFVDTTLARGSGKTLRRLERKLGWDGQALWAPDKAHVLVFGHIGCGKSTELRHHLANVALRAPLHVVNVDLLATLDRNNLQFAEVLLVMAQALAESLTAANVDLPTSALQGVRDWFAKVQTFREEFSKLEADLTSSASGGFSLPGIVSLLTKFTASFKTGASDRTERRNEIRTRFTELASAFNDLVRRAEESLSARKGANHRVVFLVDGADKLRGKDAEQFFIDDAVLILQVRALAVYTAPLHLKYEGRLVGALDAELVLPIVKLQDAAGVRFEAGWEAMKQLLLLRADRGLFASDAEIARLIEMSGGHPREMLRLLRYACELADGKVDAGAVNAAVKVLAADYRRFLTANDYSRLAEVDRMPTHDGNDDVTRGLLQRLALLEYNDGSWRRSHPAVRGLDGYRAAAGP